MQRRQRPEPADEPAVTFEIEEAPRGSARDRLGAAGAAAAAGAGLISGGATPQVSDSFDVFDDPPSGVDPIPTQDSIPSTSFAEVQDAASDPDFPLIDFSVPGPVTVEADLMHGAAGEVGGGFTLDTPASDEALSAPDFELGPLDPFSGDFDADDDLDDDLDDLDVI